MDNVDRIVNIKTVLIEAQSPCNTEFDYNLSDIVVESVTCNNYGIDEVVFSEDRSDMPSVARTERQESMKVLTSHELQSIFHHLDGILESVKKKPEQVLTLGTIQAAVGRAVQSTLSRTVTMGITNDNDLITHSNSDIAKLVLQKIGEELREYFPELNK